MQVEHSTGASVQTPQASNSTVAALADECRAMEAKLILAQTKLAWLWHDMGLLSVPDFTGAATHQN